MGTQRLNAKNIRRIAAATGQDVTRAWSGGGYVMGFATRDHRHGYYDKKTGLWDWDTNPIHMTSCLGPDREPLPELDPWGPRDA